MKVLMTCLLLFFSFVTPSLAIGVVAMGAPKGGGGTSAPVNIFPEELAPDNRLLQPVGGTFWKDAKDFYPDHGYLPTARQRDLLANPWLWMHLIDFRGGSYVVPGQGEFQLRCERIVPTASAELALQTGECSGLAKMVKAKFASELEYLSWRTERRIQALVVLFVVVIVGSFFIYEGLPSVKERRREEAMEV